MKVRVPKILQGPIFTKSLKNSLVNFAIFSGLACHLGKVARERKIPGKLKFHENSSNNPKDFTSLFLGQNSFVGIPIGLHIIWKVIWIHSDAPGHLKTWFHRWLQTESKLLSNSKTCKPRYNTNFTKHLFSRGFHFWKISFNYIFICGCTN